MGDVWRLKNLLTARFISYQQISAGPSNLTPLPRASGPTLPHWRETSGSVGSLRPSKKPRGSAASRSASIRCGEACAGPAVGPDARTAEACPTRFFHAHLNETPNKRMQRTRQQRLRSKVGRQWRRVGDPARSSRWRFREVGHAERAWVTPGLASQEQIPININNDK